VHADESLTQAEIEELAAEAGLSPGAVQQALAEVRAGALQAPRPPGALERVLGKSSIVVERTVRGSAPELLRRIDRLLRAQMLRKKRDFGARSLWEPAPGLLPRLRRALDWSGHLTLSLVHELDVSVVDAGPGQATLRFVADAGALQRKVVAGASLGTAVGLGAALALWAMGTPVALEWLAAAGATAAGSLASLRTYRREMTSTTTALEHLCDTLERDPTPPPSPLEMLFAR
jgi:hypothetical protein